MYKPANIREFVTPAEQFRTNVSSVNGRTQKAETKVADLRGKFKQKQTHDLTANNLTVVRDETTFTTWWKDDFKAGDFLVIDGAKFEVYGQPENVEMRGRYAVLRLRRLEGGA